MHRKTKNLRDVVERLAEFMEVEAVPDGHSWTLTFKGGAVVVEKRTTKKAAAFLADQVRHAGRLDEARAHVRYYGRPTRRGTSGWELEALNLIRMETDHA